MFKEIRYNLKDFIIGNLFRRGLFAKLSDKQIITLDYLITFGKLPNLSSPKKFSEKLQWLKLYGGLHKYSQYADRVAVRNIVKKKVGQKYLIPLFGIWDKFEDINFKKLPKTFALKATHGSGCVFVCKDKAKINKTILKKKVKKWLAHDYYKDFKDPSYLDIAPKLIAEAYLEDSSGGLYDYKIQCFNGEPKIIEVHVDRATNHRTAFYDLEWKRLPFRVAFEPEDHIAPIKKPEKLSEMLNVAKKLAKGTAFLRVDLYYVRKKIYFGELTFTPNNGLLELEPDTYDYKLGKLIKLQRLRN